MKKCTSLVNAWWFLTKRTYLCNQHSEDPSWSNTIDQLGWWWMIPLDGLVLVVVGLASFTRHSPDVRCIIITTGHRFALSSYCSVPLCGSAMICYIPWSILLLMDARFFSILVIRNSAAVNMHLPLSFSRHWYTFLLCAPWSSEICHVPRMSLRKSMYSH